MFWTISRPGRAAEISAGFFDPDKAYRSLLSFIAAGSEEGRAARNRWEEQQAASGIRVEEEILSWLGDEFAFTTFSLPRSLFDPGSWALLFRCESPPDLARFLEDLAERARTENLNVVEEEHGGTAFRVLYLPIPLFPVTPFPGRGQPEGRLYRYRRYLCRASTLDPAGPRFPAAGGRAGERRVGDIFQPTRGQD